MRKSNESFLHRFAKEALYKEIKSSGYLSMKNYPDERLGNHGVYMEFPSLVPDGNYPDECACSYSLCVGKEMGGCIHELDEYDIHDLKDFNQSSIIYDRYSLLKKPGYCCCSDCEFLNYNGVVVHDIASIHKGIVIWAVEIINKHLPNWKVEPTYPVYLIKAENILKRISETPVFVEEKRYVY